MSPRARSTVALLGSVLFHAAFVGSAGPVAARMPAHTWDDDWPAQWMAPTGGGDTLDIEALLDEGPAGAKSEDVAGVHAGPQAPEPTRPEQPKAKPPVPAAPVPPPAPEPAAPDPVASADTDTEAPVTATAPTASSSATTRPSPPEPPPERASSTEGIDGAPANQQLGKGLVGAYGAKGAHRGVRVLAPAFARAVPAAVSGDPAWARLPLGQAGQVEVTIVVQHDGHIAQVVVAEDAAAHLQRLVQRTMVLLRAGRFSLSGWSQVGAGRETLRIRVELSERDPIELEGVGPDVALQLGHEPPSPKAPGKAYFTLASGRHFAATIAIVSSERTADDLPDAN